MVDNELDKISENSWLMWSKHVLMTLEYNAKCLHEIKQDVRKMEKQIARLQVKSGIWGFIGGAIPAVAAVLIWVLKSHQ
jgi:hypothetical protein